MQRICYNCFRNIQSDGKCPYCGFDITSMQGKYRTCLQPGTLLVDRYLLGRVLGQGGFGITYVAYNNLTRSRVAIKEYFPTELASRDFGTSNLALYSRDKLQDFKDGKEQFLEEAKTLAQFVGNDHIINIQSYFEANGTAYFAMEYAEGVNLKQYMNQHGGPLSVHETNRILLPIMEALDWVHSKGIVHRDISPDNIMIRTDGNAKLIDFGAARYSTGEMSKSLDVILKHGFAPKEQYMRRGKQGPFTDVYALAATYYYAITGKIPPDALERTEEDNLVRPSAFGAKIRPSTEQVLLKALAVDAKDRYQRMSEFYKALFETMPQPFDEEADGEAPAKKSQPVKQSNRSKMPFFISVLLLALIAGIAFFLVSNREKGESSLESSTDVVADEGEVPSTKPDVQETESVVQNSITPSETPGAPVVESIAPSEPSATPSANDTTDLNEVLYDENGIIVTLLSIQKIGDHDFTIRTKLENNTQDEYSGGHIIANSGYADEVNINISWEGPFSVPPGKTVTFKHYIHPNDFIEAGVENGFEKLEFQITLSKDNYLTIITVDGTIDGKHFK